jgi:hypothetical protein
MEPVEPVELFDQIAALANPEALNQLDNGRLQDYISTTYRAELPVDVDELMDKMKSKDFNDNTAYYVVGMVVFGIDLLKRGGF